jgi:hypothetical protein
VRALGPAVFPNRELRVARRKYGGFLSGGNLALKEIAPAPARERHTLLWCGDTLFPWVLLLSKCIIL